MNTWRGLLLTLLAGSPALAAPFPGGVLDATGRTAYVAAPKGIEAIDLATGQTRWSSTDSQRPLFVAGETLFALSLASDSFAVIGLDLTGKGDISFRSRRIATPRWATPSGAAGQTFAVTWSQEKRTLVIAWLARRRPRVGPGKESRGLAKIDLVSGHVHEAAEIRHAAPPLALPRMLEKQSVRWHQANGGQVMAVTEDEAASPKNGVRSHRLTLRSWNERTSKEAPPRELIRGERPKLLCGADGLHLWVRDAGSPAGEKQGDWLVYSSLDGDLVARVPFVAGTTQAMMHGGRAYCLAGASGRMLLDGNAGRGYVLHAFDPETGKATWTRPLSRFAARD